MVYAFVGNASTLASSVRSSSCLYLPVPSVLLSGAGSVLLVRISPLLLMIHRVVDTVVGQTNYDIDHKEAIRAATAFHQELERPGFACDAL